MKTIFNILLLLFAVLPLSIAIANEDITGTWQGKIVIGPDTELTIQFIISQDADGSYAVVLNTPDEGNFRNVEANEVVYNAGNLKVDVAELSGSYNGVVNDRKIEGEWKQEGTSFPLILKPYEKPTLSKKDMDTLLGTWHGNLQSDIGEPPTWELRFEMSEEGEFTEILTLPDMGGPVIPLTDMGISDDIITFKIPVMNAKFKGKLTDKKIVGALRYTDNVRASDRSITLVKGEYKVPVYKLDLPKEIKDQLIGKWNGRITLPMQEETTTVVVSFKISKNDDFFGFVDMPEAKLSGMPIIDAKMSHGKLVLTVTKMRNEFKGKLSADKIVGEWKEMGNTMPLSLTKE